MSDTVEQAKKDVVSPTLRDIDSTTEGHYYIKNKWEVDSTNHVLVRTGIEVTLGP